MQCCIDWHTIHTTQHHYTSKASKQYYRTARVKCTVHVLQLTSSSSTTTTKVRSGTIMEYHFWIAHYKMNIIVVFCWMHFSLEVLFFVIINAHNILATNCNSTVLCCVIELYWENRMWKYTSALHKTTHWDTKRFCRIYCFSFECFS